MRIIMQQGIEEMELASFFFPQACGFSDSMYRYSQTLGYYGNTINRTNKSHTTLINIKLIMIQI